MRRINGGMSGALKSLRISSGPPAPGISSTAGSASGFISWAAAPWARILQPLWWGRTSASTGHSGIFAADSSIFPNAPGINPSLTIMALSKRAADTIIKSKV